MKASIKFAVVGALALIGSVANAANINNLTNAAGGSDLVLFLQDSATNTFFVQDLGVQTSALRSTAQLAADGGTAYNADTPAQGPLSVPSLLNGYTNANLAAYVSGHTNASWTILGGIQGTGTQQIGSQAIALTSTIDQLAAYWDSPSVSATRGQFQSFFVNDINQATYTNGVSTTAGWGDGGIGANAPASFQDPSHANGATVGTAQTLYLLATGGNNVGANTYASQYTLTLSTAGILSYDAPNVPNVPIPAAIWLLGSGLMGLVGIGRRRNAVNVAA